MSTQTDTIRKALDVIWKELDAISGLPSYAHVAVERARRIDKARDQITGIVSELEAQPAMTREQIADRIREEYAKHPTLDWADLAAAKIVSSMRDVAQPPAREVVGMTTDEAMIVIDNATDEDLKRNDPDLWQDLRKEFDFFLSVKRDAALASQPKDPAPTVDQMVDVFHGWQTANHNGWSQDAINADLRTRLKTLFP